MSSQGDSQPSQDSTMTMVQENTHEILYFAYGSNLSTEQMRQRCPHSMAIGLGYLDGWEWFINERGYANIARLDDPDSDDAEAQAQAAAASSSSSSSGKVRAKEEEDAGVYGLLYLLPPDDEALLDRYEGVPYAYEKFQVDVEWVRDEKGEKEAETVRALVYVDEQRVGEDVPREEYVGRMERGIRDAVENWGMAEGYADRVMRRFWKK